MENKTAPAMTVLSCQIRTNMKNMLTDVGDLNKEIYKTAIEAGFQPTGPQYWVYKWESVDPESDFDLRITLPVATFGKALNNGVFNLVYEDAFKCISKTHTGAYDTLKESYSQIMEYIEAKKIVPGNVCREVYMNCDFEQQDNCITEIQFGIS